MNITATNKQSFRVKLRKHVYNSYTIDINPRQLPLNSNLILELFIHFSFGERLWSTVIGDVICLFDNPLDPYCTIVSIESFEHWLKYCEYL